MEHSQIKEWLDKLVDNIEERRALKDFNNQIYASEPDNTVLIHKGIDIIAEAIGANLTEMKLTEDFHNSYRYNFVYRGIEFSAFKKERILSFEEADQC